ncbi:MAG TPA: PPOX class F420-dependent oxidoreductase [Ktedonobacteraceae bacterium]|nr:PPOX class F420-dependent oxidoreductase [Ktedonobacteraceae bacterium]
MPAHIPDEALELFQLPALAHLATLMLDGTPQVTPIWIDFDGTYILVNTLKGRQKALNMEKRPKVGLDIVDPSNSFHWLSVRGHVVEITEEGADAHIDKMAKKYLGQDKYGFHKPEDVRVIFKIQPDLVNYQTSPRKVHTSRQ